MEHVPIASLTPSLASQYTKEIRAVISLVWPYSSSTRSCALLLAEPDFRLRQRKGQVRVRLTGPSAKQVAKTGIGIGDEITLRLKGAQWLEGIGDTRTPGKSVDWEIRFAQVLDAEIHRDGAHLSKLSIDHPTPSPEPDAINVPGSTSQTDQTTPHTPAPQPTVRRISSFAPFEWVSPSFVKRTRDSFGAYVDPAYDPLTADTSRGDTRERKRIRRSWEASTEWRYTDGISSPEKTSHDEWLWGDEKEKQTMREDEEEVSMSAVQLPRTPLSARQLSEPAEKVMNPALAVDETTGQIVLADAPAGSHEAEMPNHDTADIMDEILDFEAGESQQPLDVPIEAEERVIVDKDEVFIEQAAITATPPVEPELAAAEERLLSAEDADTEQTTDLVHGLSATEDSHHRMDRSDEFDAPTALRDNVDLEEIEDESDIEHLHEAEAEDEEDEDAEEEEGEADHVSEDLEEDGPTTPAPSKQSAVIELSDGEEESESDEAEHHAQPQQEQQERSERTFTFGPPGSVQPQFTVSNMPPPVLPNIQTVFAPITPTRGHFLTPTTAQVDPTTPRLNPVPSPSLPLPSPFPPASGDPSSSYLDFKPGSSAQAGDEAPFETHSDDHHFGLDGTMVSRFSKQAEYSATYDGLPNNLQLTSPALAGQYKEVDASNLADAEAIDNAQEEQKSRAVFDRPEDIDELAYNEERFRGPVYETGPRTAHQNTEVPDTSRMSSPPIELLPEVAAVDDERRSNVPEVASSMEPPRSSAWEVVDLGSDESQERETQPSSKQDEFLTSSDSSAQQMQSDVVPQDDLHQEASALPDRIEEEEETQEPQTAPGEADTDYIPSQDVLVSSPPAVGTSFQDGTAVEEAAAEDQDVISSSDFHTVATSSRPSSQHQAVSPETLDLSRLEPSYMRSSQRLRFGPSPQQLEVDEQKPAWEVRGYVKNTEEESVAASLSTELTTASRQTTVEPLSDRIEPPVDSFASDQHEQPQQSMPAELLPATVQETQLQSANKAEEEDGEEEQKTPTNISYPQLPFSVAERTPPLTQVDHFAPLPQQEQIHPQDSLMLTPDATQQPFAATQSSPYAKNQEIASTTAHVGSLIADPSNAIQPTTIRLSQTSLPLTPPSTTSSPALGVRTALAYYTPLSLLPQHVNYTSSQSFENTIDILATVSRSSKTPERARAGPRDWNTAFSITDESIGAHQKVLVQCFRPWEEALPAAEIGDTVLLRGFTVKTRKGKLFLLSGESSGWAVWCFRNDGTTSSTNELVENPGEGEPKPTWARRKSQQLDGAGCEEAHEEVCGPPVEIGDEERKRARELSAWWRAAAQEAMDGDDSQVYGTQNSTNDDEGIAAKL